MRDSVASRGGRDGADRGQAVLLLLPSQRLTIGDTDRRYRALQRRLFDIADFVAKTFGDKFAFDRREILKLPSLRQFIGAAGDQPPSYRRKSAWEPAFAPGLGFQGRWLGWL